MATPPNKSTANTDSLANQTTLETTADNVFIDSAATAINQAIALGEFAVRLTTFENVNIQNIQNYFIGLGYTISYPILSNPVSRALITNPGGPPFQPAQLFGEDFENFFLQGPLSLVNLTNPVDIVISWK